MALKMILSLLLTLPLLQIESDPSPEYLAQALRIDRFGISDRQYGVNSSDPFPINRYLALAQFLQKLPERERITWLRMAAASSRLDEVAVYIGRMLIVGEDSPLRPMRVPFGNHIAGSKASEFPDKPLAIFDGIPFMVADYPDPGDMSSLGMQRETVEDYMEFLLKKGTWRTTKFRVRDNAELREIAERYFLQLEKTGHAITDEMKAEILRQCNVPLKMYPKRP